MKRKFSLPGIELPKFISSMRLDGDSSRTVRDPFAQDPESRPPTPKSVRPPLPRDLNSELVAACTWIATHPRPSHERWESISSSKPALDPAVIKQRHVQPRMEIPQRSKSARSMNSINALLPVSVTDRRPDHGGRRVVEDMQVAQSRADELMQSSEPLRTVTTLHIPGRASSHTHSRSVPIAAAPALAVKTDPVDRQKTMARSDSLCTTRTGRTGRTSGSTPHTNSTEYPRSASTGMTSVVNTPARSKSASSQAINTYVESGSVPDSDAINGELLRQEFERNRRAAAGRDTGRESSENALCRATYIPSGNMDYADELALETMQRSGRRRSRSIPRIRTADHDQMDQQAQSGADQSQTGRSRSRFRSRFRSESRSNMQAGQRSESRAGTVASELRSRYNRLPGSGRQLASRASSVAASVRRYLRPRNSTASMISRDDAARNASFSDRATTSSHRSVHSPTSEPEERQRGRWPGLKLVSRSSSRTSRDDRGRKTPESNLYSRGNDESLEPALAKPVIDLNRELPPLPSLAQWTETEDVRIEAPQYPSNDTSLEYLHVHPLRRGLPQIPPMVGNDKAYTESVGTSRPSVPVRARRPVPTTATIHAPTQSIASGTVAQSARTTGRRQPSQTIATANVPGPSATSVPPQALRRTQSRHDMSSQTKSRNHNDTTRTHNHARTRSDLSKAPSKYSINDFKRRMQSPQKSDLDLSLQNKSSGSERQEPQANKSGWKSWANKLKPRATPSYADSLNLNYHRRHESADSSGAAASPVIRF